MPRPLHISLRIATSLLVLSGYFALSAVREYGALLLAPGIAMVLLAPAGEYLDRRFRAYRTLTGAITFVYFCFIPFTVLTLGILNGVIALVIFIQIHCMLHIKEERNYYYIFLMAFFLLLASCFLNPEPVIAVILVLFIVASVWSLVALRLHLDFSEAQDAGPGALAGRPVPLAATGLQGGAPGFGAAFALSVAGLSLAAVAMTGAIFMFTPRIEAGFLGRSDVPVMQTGLPDQVDLAGGGFLEQDMTPVMRVELPDEPQGILAGTMYWRTRTLPRYLDSRWVSKGLNHHYEPNVGPIFPENMFHLSDTDPHRAERARVDDRKLVHQIIYMDDVPDQGVPVLDFVQRIALIGSPNNAKLMWSGQRDFSLNLTIQGARRMTYEAWSEIRPRDPEALRAVRTDYEALMDPEDYALLTYHNLGPQVLDQVETLTANLDNPYDIAAALRDYLGGDDFLYTLDLPFLPDRNPIDEFLLVTRRGHCELFASALALMLRSQGIPARVVLGYRGGEWNPSDQSYVIRQTMAHLWTEVWFPEHGWIVFDPSPRVDDAELGGLQRLARYMSGLSIKAKMIWYRDVIGFDRSLQLEALRGMTLGLIQTLRFGGPDLQDPLAEAGLGGEAAAASRRFNPAPWLLALAVLLAAWLVRERMRKPAAAPALTPDQQRAIRLYRGLLRKLERHGAQARGKTAEELRQEVAANGWKDPSGAIAVLDAYNAVRFGGRPLPRTAYRELAGRLEGLEQQTGIEFGGRLRRAGRGILGRLGID